MTPEQQRALLHVAERYAALLEQLVTNGAVLTGPGRADELRRLRALIALSRPEPTQQPHGMADKGGNVR